MEYDKDEKEKLLAYMKSFEYDSAGGYVDDCVTSETTKEEDIGYNDGEYFWSTQDIYHIEKYNAKVLDSFMKKVMEPN